MKFLDGRRVAEKIKEHLKNQISELKKKNIFSMLAVILIGDDPVSRLYVKIKEKTCRELGIGLEKYFLPGETNQNEVLDLIEKLNRDDKINAIIVQLPLPRHFDTDKIISTISPLKDADGLNPQSRVTPPTAAAIMELLKYYKISLKNRDVYLVGYGRLVGKPLAPLLKKVGAKLTICTVKTRNLGSKTKKADILISAAGVPHLIKKEMVKEGVVVIDAGTSLEKTSDIRYQTIDNRRKMKRIINHKYQITKISGDVDFANVKKIASAITLPKGGVGPLTIAKLLENVVKLNTRR